MKFFWYMFPLDVFLKNWAAPGCRWKFRVGQWPWEANVRARHGNALKLEPVGRITICNNDIQWYTMISWGNHKVLWLFKHLFAALCMNIQLAYAIDKIRSCTVWGKIFVNKTAHRSDVDRVACKWLTTDIGRCRLFGEAWSGNWFSSKRASFWFFS